MYGDASPTQQQTSPQQTTTSHDHKGLGISSTTSNINNVGSGGIRSGMASLGLTPSNNSNNNENISTSTGSGSGTSRIAGGRRSRRV
jgi:hypothetical protein